MGKKYILTDDTYVIGDHMLHRIQAVKSFGDVKKVILVVSLNVKITYLILVIVGYMITHMYMEMQM